MYSANMFELNGWDIKDLTFIMRECESRVVGKQLEEIWRAFYYQNEKSESLAYEKNVFTTPMLGESVAFQLYRLVVYKRFKRISIRNSERDIALSVRHWKAENSKFIVKICTFNSTDEVVMYITEKR